MNVARVIAQGASLREDFLDGALRGHAFEDAVDAVTGKLVAVPGSPVEHVSQAYSVAVEAAGRFAYVGSDSGKVLQFAIERGNPGAVMCSYNKVNGIHACEHPFLLTQVLRNEWRWPGYVMTDWGAAHSTAAAANAGLDQESGFGLQMDGWFSAAKLRAALGARQLTQASTILRHTEIGPANHSASLATRKVETR